MTWAVEHMDPNDPDTENTEKVKELTCTGPVTTEESGFLSNFLSVGLIVLCTLLKL